MGLTGPGNPSRAGRGGMRPHFNSVTELPAREDGSGRATASGSSFPFCTWPCPLGNPTKECARTSSLASQLVRLSTRGHAVRSAKQGEGERGLVRRQTQLMAACCTRPFSDGRPFRRRDEARVVTTASPTTPSAPSSTPNTSLPHSTLLFSALPMARRTVPVP